MGQCVSGSLSPCWCLFEDSGADTGWEMDTFGGLYPDDDTAFLTTSLVYAKDEHLARAARGLLIVSAMTLNDCNTSCDDNMELMVFSVARLATRHTMSWVSWLHLDFL